MTADFRDEIGGPRPGHPQYLLDEQEAIEAYRASQAFLTDAIDHLACTYTTASPVVIAAVLAWWETQPEFADTIADIRCGDRELR